MGRSLGWLAIPNMDGMLARPAPILIFTAIFPCHRVVNSQGRTAPDWAEQRFLLEAEGVEFKPNGRVNMKKYQWKLK